MFDFWSGWQSRWLSREPVVFPSFRDAITWNPINKKSRTKNVRLLVGVAGFEPAASCSQSRRDNRATLHPEFKRIQYLQDTFWLLFFLFFVLKALLLNVLKIEFDKSIPMAYLTLLTNSNLNCAWIIYFQDCQFDLYNILMNFYYIKCKLCTYLLNKGLDPAAFPHCGTR